MSADRDVVLCVCMYVCICGPVCVSVCGGSRQGFIRAAVCTNPTMSADVDECVADINLQKAALLFPCVEAVINFLQQQNKDLPPAFRSA